MSKYAWIALHAGAAFVHVSYVVMIGYELATTGELSRPARAAGHYSAGDVVLFLLIFGLTAVSALRAIWFQETGE